MKRSGAELPLCTWSACGGRLNGVAVATVKRGGGGDAPHCVLSRCASIINGTACCLPAVLPRPLDANLWGAACGASLWAAECDMRVIWPFGEKNALRRPKKVKKAMEAQYNQEKCRVVVV